MTVIQGNQYILAKCADHVLFNFIKHCFYSAFCVWWYRACFPQHPAYSQCTTPWQTEAVPDNTKCVYICISYNESKQKMLDSFDMRVPRFQNHSFTEFMNWTRKKTKKISEDGERIKPYTRAVVCVWASKCAVYNRRMCSKRLLFMNSFISEKLPMNPCSCGGNWSFCWGEGSVTIVAKPFLSTLS